MPQEVHEPQTVDPLAGEERLRAASLQRVDLQERRMWRGARLIDRVFRLLECRCGGQLRGRQNLQRHGAAAVQFQRLEQRSVHALRDGAHNPIVPGYHRSGRGLSRRPGCGIAA